MTIKKNTQNQLNKPRKLSKQSKHAIFVGRFQPFHIGHYSIVEKILWDYERLILVIGSAEKSWTEENPWTLQEREEIIRASIPLELQERMDIIGLDDTADDDTWCENLKNLIMPPW
jgi:bifunctional NMN adenylyltransferase/nudix hydrolase